MRKFTAVIGAQWGDEGKGKVVDTLVKNFDGVVRYQGGPNSGHTIYHNDEKHVLHVIPSGIFHPDKLCLITDGVVIDPTKLVLEISSLRQKGINCQNLRISPNCNLILPYHIMIDQIREGRKNKLGTTKSGIGPCYSDKIARIGIRFKDLFDDASLLEALQINLEEKNPLLTAYGFQALEANSLVENLRPLRNILRPFLADTGSLLKTSQQSFMLEGAQGAMLDIDHGTYPYVTSSQTGYAGILAGTGLPARTSIDVIGVIKAYNTRVGTGPFPTEQNNEIGERIRKQGKEFGSTTGRPRRCGWVDIPQIKYALDLTGTNEIVMTKLDVLSGFDEIKICTDYTQPGSDWEDATPVYEKMPGFAFSGVTSWEDLPQAAKHYVLRVEELIGKPITGLSLGPKRQEMISLGCAV